MSVRFTGAAIREARQHAGLSQEKLSDGICTVKSLSRIENGTAGISPSTFQALMARANASQEVFPIFENMEGARCYLSLSRAAFYLKVWQLDEGHSELNITEQMYWTHNKLHYQAWLFLHGLLQFRSGIGKHNDMLQLFSKALYATQPEICFDSFEHQNLTTAEIGCLIYIAQEFFYLEDEINCKQICSQVFSILERSEFTYSEKDELAAECAVVYCKYLISNNEYIEASDLASKHLHKMAQNFCETSLLELTFTRGICDALLGDLKSAKKLFENVLYAATAIHSPYAVFCQNQLINLGLLDILDLSIPTFSVSLREYPNPGLSDIDFSEFSSGIFDIYSGGCLSVGGLIQSERTKLKISQDVLCRGICSKSKLSKIEKNILMPTVLMAETLLSRLGISEHCFTFFGNYTEAKVHEIHSRFKQLGIPEGLNLEQMLGELRDLSEDKDILYQQFYLFEKSCFMKDSLERIAFLKEILKMTLKDFDIYKICNYHLSDMELNILNSIAIEYLYTDQCESYEGLIYARYLVTYHQNHAMDCLMQSQHYAQSLYALFGHLYHAGYYKEVIDVFEKLTDPVLNYSMLHSSLIYFYYSEALAQCGFNDKAILYANYCQSIEALFESYKNIEILKKELKEIFVQNNSSDKIRG